MICILSKLLHWIFHYRHVIRKIEVTPPTRLQAMLEYNYNLETKDTGPCGGYSTQYACMCDYHSLPYREEVAWVGHLLHKFLL